MRILLIEDDRKAARLLAKGLLEEGFVVDVAPTGEDGEERATVNDYDVIVLDWLLPGKDGLAVCRALRASGNSIPILMLTARDSVTDRVSGLRTGADDYLTKPFAFAELLARVRALLRRSRVAQPSVLRVADLTLDPATRRVTRAGVPVTLTPREHAILEVLMRASGAPDRSRTDRACSRGRARRRPTLIRASRQVHSDRRSGRPGCGPKRDARHGAPADAARAPRAIA